MNTMEKKAFSRRFIEMVWNEGKFDKLDTYLTPNCKYIDAAGPIEFKGADTFKKYVMSVRKAFPDFLCKIEDEIAEGDKVVTIMKITATHEGEFLGVPPSHKKATLPSIAISRFEGDRIAETFVLWDTLTFLRTAGAFEAREVAVAG
jgi:steroid delta-isomerase-like uncharacterized protein